MKIDVRSGFLWLVMLTIIFLASTTSVGAAPAGQGHGHALAGAHGPMAGQGHGPMAGMAGHGRGHGMGPGRGYGGHGGQNIRSPHNAAAHFLRKASRLGLTDEQVAKLVILRDDYTKKNAVAHEQLKAAKMDVGRLLMADSIDLDKVNAKLGEVGPLEAQLWDAFAKQLKEIKDLLTAEQKQLLRAMKR